MKVAAMWLTAGLAAAGFAADAQPLAVCFPEHDPPRSLRTDAQGFDVDVARLLAAEFQRGLRIVWVPERYQTDIESSDVDYRPILGGQCDVQLSAPGPAAPFRRLTLSEPYYGAAFELVPENSTFRWGESYAGTFAVRANSVAHVALDALGVRWTMQARTEGILKALHDGAATSALLWGPNLAAADVKRNANFEPPAVLRWNLHAIVRRDAAVLADVNRAFADEAVQGRIRALQRRHDIPPHAPFVGVHTRAALKALHRP